MNADHKDGVDGAKVPELAWLRWLVTALTVTMILGITAIVILLWLKLSAPMLPELPPAITLPDGARASAVTFAPDAYVVLTDQAEILVYDLKGTLRGRTRID